MRQVTAHALAIEADLSDSAQVDAAFAQCVAELGGLDLAYLNAGMATTVSDLGSTSTI